MIYYADKARHLVCVQYTRANLFAMAEHLGIKPRWFHAVPHPHFDIPKRMIEEILARDDVNVVSAREILRIIKRTGSLTPRKTAAKIAPVDLLRHNTEGNK